MTAFCVRLGKGLKRSPWRVPEENFKWTEDTADKLREETRKILPTKKSGIKRHLKMLIIGPTGHGKSSLINSFASVSQKKNIGNAAEKEHVTTIYRSFGLTGDLVQLHVGDIAVTQTRKKEELKLFLEDTELLLKGKIKSGYEFLDTETISEENDHFVAEPTVSDMIHCVIIVFDCSEVNNIHNHYKDIFPNLLERINKLNIPVMVVLTKADTVSPHVKHDIKSLFRCRLIRDAVKSASAQLAIPKTKVFPVVNFEEKDAYSWKSAIPIQLVIKFGLLMAKTHAHDVEC